MSASGHCALRAPTTFSGRTKTIRLENVVMFKSQDGLGLFLYKIVDCARMVFHRCAIGDPRGRLLVRATSQPRNNDGRDSNHDV